MVIEGYEIIRPLGTQVTANLFAATMGNAHTAFLGLYDNIVLLFSTAEEGTLLSFKILLFYNKIKEKDIEMNELYAKRERFLV